MGNSQSACEPYQTLSGDDLVEFTRLTPFSRFEIESFYDDFQKLDHSALPRRNFRARAEDVARLPILKCNPFKDRIIQIFADQNSFLTFEDFLDMMSVFHPRCSKMVKLCHAFAIYDFDNDGYLGLEDLKRVVKRLTHRGDVSESIITQAKAILQPSCNFSCRKTLEQLPSG